MMNPEEKQSLRFFKSDGLRVLSVVTHVRPADQNRNLVFHFDFEVEAVLDHSLVEQEFRHLPERCKAITIRYQVAQLNDFILAFLIELGISEREPDPLAYQLEIGRAHV